MRSDEYNWHVHGTYTEENTLSSNANVKDEDEWRKINVHETLSENQTMDVSESECSINYKTLSQNNSTKGPANVITELKDNDNKEPSIIEKGTSYAHSL